MPWPHPAVLLWIYLLSFAEWLFTNDTWWSSSSTCNASSRRRILGGDSGPNLGDIVALPHLRELRDSGPLSATPIFDSLSELDHDHLIWCTGFRPALGPFRHLMRGREPAVKNLHLVGYGNWTGDGSATLMGVGPFAKRTARVVAGRVDEARQHEF